MSKRFCYITCISVHRDHIQRLIPNILKIVVKSCHSFCLFLSSGNVFKTQAHLVLFFNFNFHFIFLFVLFKKQKQKLTFNLITFFLKLKLRGDEKVASAVLVNGTGLANSSSSYIWNSLLCFGENPSSQRKDTTV